MMIRSVVTRIAEPFNRLATAWRQMVRGKPVEQKQFSDDGHEFLRMTAPFTYDDVASPEKDRPEVVRGFA